MKTTVTLPLRMIISNSASGYVATGRINARYVWLISLVAALGGLLFGYDWVVIGGAKPFFEPFFGISKTVVKDGVSQVVVDGVRSGWANSCALLGCLLGSLGTGALSDKYGRRKLLVVSALIFGISSVLTGWAPNFPWFILWRICGGVAIGMASSLSPMYIAEVAPASQRGRLVALNQLTIVIGILAAQIVNWWIAVSCRMRPRRAGRRGTTQRGGAGCLRL